MKQTFIGQYYVNDLSICDELISYHKNSDNKIKLFRNIFWKSIPEFHGLNCWDLET